MNNKRLLSGFSLIIGFSTIACGTVLAETITQRTVTETQSLPNVREVNFAAFDSNHDGFYTMAEVGDILFFSFDTNGNHMIDNQEWNQRTVMTITPIEQKTFRYIDYNDDGIAEETMYTYDTFYKASGLMRFDDNKNGLTPAEFINTSFEDLDNDGNKLISIEEWRQAYLGRIPAHVNPVNYNR